MEILLKKIFGESKKGVIATIKTIEDEQDTAITYYFGQELSKNKISLEEYIEKISRINKENIINIAQKVKINTIYFLTNDQKEKTTEEGRK